MNKNAYSTLMDLCASQRADGYKVERKAFSTIEFECLLKQTDGYKDEMKKVYLDRTESKNACIGVFVKDAEVIAAGTTVYAMSKKDKNAEYERYAKEYGIHFIFEDEIPEISFYAVPQIDIFASDGRGGLFGTVGGISDFSADAPICYVDKNLGCFLAAKNGDLFLKTADSWKEQLIPYEEIVFYRSVEEAKQQLEFIEPMHERQICLETERCIIRNVTSLDTGELYDVLSDEEVMKYIEPPFTLEQTAEFIKNAGLSDDPLIYAVEYRETGKAIGHVIYHPYGKNSYEIGWILNRKYWGRGIAEELTAALIAFSREKGIRELVMECSPRQAATKHIALKYHFIYEGMQDGCEVYRLKTGKETGENTPD